MWSRLKSSPSCEENLFWFDSGHSPTCNAVPSPRFRVPEFEDGPPGEGPQMEEVLGRVRVIQESSSDHPLLPGIHSLRGPVNILMAFPWLQPTEISFL